METNLINDNFVHDSNYKRIYIKQNMDYEKKYKDALERARKHRDNDGLTLEQYKTIDIIFPELQENDNDDEKIRKEIIDFIYDKTDNYKLREKSNSWLAWLEKQDNTLKYNNDWSEDDENYLYLALLSIQKKKYCCK